MSDLDQTINQVFDNPADRMIAKLWLDQYDVEEIARFAGLAVEAIVAVVERARVVALGY